ncbi:hypothetical protein ASG92_03930 [Arthrobacter sp. Soil736]|nr:hypothetical protein ASG92_03930 [Arthrobacter sp. Soil736]
MDACCLQLPGELNTLVQRDGCILIAVHQSPHEQVTHDLDRPSLTEDLRGARETAELPIVPRAHDAMPTR